VFKITPNEFCMMIKKSVWLSIIACAHGFFCQYLLATMASSPVQLLVDVAAQTVTQQAKLGAATTQADIHTVHKKQTRAYALSLHQIETQIRLCEEFGEGSIEQVIHKAEDIAVKNGDAKTAMLLVQGGEAAQQGWYHSFCAKKPHWQKLVAIVVASIGFSIGVIATGK
jgi:hypothetical protein